ncbi:MAG: TonB-dependent receptor [Saprospiraceae bacterium]
MRLTRLHYVWTVLALFLGSAVFAQTQVITGTVLSQGTADPVADVRVHTEDEAYSATTGSNGRFKLAVESDIAILYFDIDGFRQNTAEVGEANQAGRQSVGTVFMVPDNLDDSPDLDRTLDGGNIQQDDDNSSQGGTVSSLLTASRDPFQQAAAFNFNATRFRIRGYDNRYTETFIDGAPVNDAEAGRPRFYIWSGLNDVTRNRYNTADLSFNTFNPSALGGVGNIDLRAGSQRPGSRVSLATSNRSWQYRGMATHNTGWMENGLAISVSASVRYADKGYSDGTYQQAYGYYLSIDKRIDKKKRVSLSILGSPSLRGGSSGHVQEVYDITQNNYFNRNWGYQAGEVRNSREYRTHQPVMSLSYEWAPSVSTNWTTTVVGMYGRNGQTRLERANAPNPLGTYYQYLPSYSLNEETRQQVFDVLQANPERLQIQWDDLYNINRRQNDVVENADGIAGNTVEGAQARYWLEEQRYDPRRISLSSRFRHALTSQFTFHGGILGQYSDIHNYQLMDDLLGADFMLNINAFAARDLGDDAAAQNDADTPNKIIREGEQLGYDYNSIIFKQQAFGQLEYIGKNLDVFGSLSVENTQQSRVGNVRNGQFPDNSLGESEKISFLTGSAKLGLTYKINGRNYLSFRGLYGTRAPDFRDAMVSPRTRNEFVPNLESETMTSFEASYQYTSPRLKAKITGYRTTFEDRLRFIRFFIETSTGNTGFGSYIMQGVDSEHLGLEAAVEYDLTSSLEVQVAMASGRYLFTSRPQANAYIDNSGAQLVTDETVYQKNFFASPSPQQAGSVALRYQGKKFWSATLTGSYTRYAFTEIAPLRRTVDAVRNLEPNSPAVKAITDQEELPSAFTLDLFASKSFKMDDKFLFLTLGANNLLNNQTILSSGREQLRYDFDSQDVNRFPNQYFYAYGLNFFLQAAYSF